MPLLNVVIIIVLIGLGLYLVNRFIPMAESIKTILNIFVVVVIVLWLVSMLFPGLDSIRIGG